ncbi:MAG: LacI family DNA-binding transcriptional regulator [Lachnospiraceae bacterium]|nr:LacI family DNA-binding transcriptional regulator [Lachnospiraceae bacterium]
MTLDQIAKELGVSKSTVSRAISGKGRIGSATRGRILSYINMQEEVQTESAAASSLTNCLSVVIPNDVYSDGIPYFHECLLGVCEAATLMDYHVLITTGLTNDISAIRSLVENRKVDGIILTRSLENDLALRYLAESHFPTGVTGRCDYEEILQVDIDNERASEELTSLLISRGYRKFALIVGEMNYHVNRSRYAGFYNAILKNNLSREKQKIYTGSTQIELLDAMLNDIMSDKVDCIICGDDVICTRVMSRLQAEGYRIPRDISIASLYNSPNLNCFSPAITAINVSARLIGNMVGKQMIQQIRGQEYDRVINLDYEILLRKSTGYLVP